MSPFIPASITVEDDPQSGEGGKIQTYNTRAAGHPIYHAITQLSGTSSSRTGVERVIASMLEGKPSRSKLVPWILAVAQAQVAGRGYVIDKYGSKVKIPGKISPKVGQPDTLDAIAMREQARFV